MFDLAVPLSDKRYSSTAKALIILGHLGGRATTAEIVSNGLEHGARTIRSWKIPTLFRTANDRVAETPQGWLLLPKASEYLKSKGYGGLDIAPPSPRSAQPIENVKWTIKPKAFVGHGRSPVWRELKDFLEKLGFEVQHFNSVSVVGVSNKERLSELLNTSDVALLVLTAEDEQADGGVHPRMNVIHEAGLFQGRLGFEKAAILLEDGCSEFSNSNGIGQIRFPKGNVIFKSEEIRDWLSREFTLADS